MPPVRGTRLGHGRGNQGTTILAAQVEEGILKYRHYKWGEISHDMAGVLVRKAGV